MVLPFRLNIGLRVKCGTESVISTYVRTNSRPESAGEFLPPIGNDVVWYSVLAENRFEKDPCQLG